LGTTAPEESNRRWGEGEVAHLSETMPAGNRRKEGAGSKGQGWDPPAVVGHTLGPGQCGPKGREPQKRGGGKLDRRLTART